MLDLVAGEPGEVIGDDLAKGGGDLSPGVVGDAGPMASAPCDGGFAVRSVHTSYCTLSTRMTNGSTRFSGISNTSEKIAATASTQAPTATRHAVRTLRSLAATRSASQDAASAKYACSAASRFMGSALLPD